MSAQLEIPASRFPSSISLPQPVERNCAASPCLALKSAGVFVTRGSDFKTKALFAWNVDNIINEGKQGEFSDHNENGQDTH